MDNFLNEDFLLDEVSLFKKKINSQKDIDYSKIKRQVKDNEIDQSKLNKLVLSVYKKDPEYIVKDLPSIGELIRYSIMFTTVIVHPVAPMVMVLIDRIVTDQINYNYVLKYISALEKELDKTDKIIKEKDLSNDKKQRLKEYKKSLETAIYKLNAYKEKIERESDRDKIKSKKDEDDDLLFEQFDREMIIFNENFVKRGVTKTKHAIKKTEEKTNNKFTDVVNGVKSKSREEVRDKYIKNSHNITKFIKAALAIGATWAINPCLTLVSIVVGTAIKSKITRREKDKLISELKFELRMVDEKIKDADSENDRKKKYDLMRLKNKLEREIDRLSFGD